MIDHRTFARYAAMRVPRYTSYPTAPNFLPVPDACTYRDWLRECGGFESISVYLHVPFCRRMCWYCGCHTTVAHREAPLARYVTRLASEIHLVASELCGRRAVAHVHWGGGTPTLLAPGAVGALDRRLRRSFDIAPDAEIGLEVDPRALTAEVASAFVKAGVNRVSIGVQTFDPRVQAAINRVQPIEWTIAAVNLFRELGVKGVNFDLIYGLPRQTAASCLETVRQALAFRPDRFAVFGYAHVPSFKPHQRNIDEAALPTPAERLHQAGAIGEALAAAGYQPIGLDHFALPDDSLARAARAGTLRRNFQGYTTDGCSTLLGFGASAISRLPAGFVQNATRIPDYQRRLAEGRLATVRICPVTAEDARRAAVIEQLMCGYRADIGSLAAEALDELERDGLVRRHGSAIEVPDEARPLVRAVAAAFDAYLPRTATQHTAAI